jgi:hypothetical protein
VTPNELEGAVRASWDALTAERPWKWTEENPAFDQCSATARVVREFLGGDILIAPVMRNDEPCGFHAWNRLPDGREIDLTRDQFRQGENIGKPEVREPVRAFLTSALLLTRVRRRLALSDRGI